MAQYFATVQGDDVTAGFNDIVYRENEQTEYSRVDECSEMQCLELDVAGKVLEICSLKEPIFEHKQTHRERVHPSDTCTKL